MVSIFLLLFESELWPQSHFSTFCTNIIIAVKVQYKDQNLRKMVNVQDLRQLNKYFLRLTSDIVLNSLNIKGNSEIVPSTEYLSIPTKVRCQCKIVADGTNNILLEQMEYKSLKMNYNIVSSIEVPLFSGNLVVRSLLKKSCV